MIIFKKYDTSIKGFVLFLTMSGLIACGTSELRNSKIEGKKLPITSEYADTPEIETFIKPYRDHINKDLDSVLSYSPETLDKSKPIDKWQTAIGNLMADVTLEAADKVLFTREKRHADICLLNHGGIRAILPKGDITTRTAFEIMPFENSLVVIALKGEQIREIADYLIKEKKPHPLAGMEILLDKDATMVKDITVEGKPLEIGKIYNVATSDYLSNGGDNMEFFKRGIATYDLDYKLRNVFIDYFKSTDTIYASKSLRVITEKQ
ncbi:5'-nucleotidase C-terminal domain-containing protein [Flavobacterium sp. MFBS3-15]|uniref:5'-nucleotidase C-terminal domain-containing protein n=1 Tax=Flavobacterium sp. MFBS3-15 TaxID=2989816 RepID=UPI00223667FD|nr:5'-nucleotidase [Flavobacterium sp. MFBS3-15]MCW4468940.1 5'-nucleotidase C-terminal domain-containing protein [Flavobacterium sp. MFBS3-15]